MPSYKVTIQGDLTSESPRRRGRGQEHVDTYAEIIKASTLANAARKVSLRAGRQGMDPRIVAVEEISEWSADLITTEQVHRALTRDCDIYDRLDPDDYDPTSCIYTDSDFHYLAQQVQQCLRTSELVPGLELSLIYSEFGGVESTMVEIRDQALGRYHSESCQLKHLTIDRSALGWDGVLAIARGLMRVAQRLM